MSAIMNLSLRVPTKKMIFESGKDQLKHYVRIIRK